MAYEVNVQRIARWRPHRPGSLRGDVVMKLALHSFILSCLALFPSIAPGVSGR